MQNNCHAIFREFSDDKKVVVQKIQVPLQKEIISSQNICLHNLFCSSMRPVCDENYEVFYQGSATLLAGLPAWESFQPCDPTGS